MKRIDYKRMEWALTHYEKIESLLSQAYYSLDGLPPEFTTSRPDAISTIKEVHAMLLGAVKEKSWLEGKLRAYKDLIDK